MLRVVMALGLVSAVLIINTAPTCQPIIAENTCETLLYEHVDMLLYILDLPLTSYLLQLTSLTAEANFTSSPVILYGLYHLQEHYLLFGAAWEDFLH